MKKYNDIFFDLDRTLWDFDRNSAETLTELFETYGLKKELGIDSFAFIETFREINAMEWRQFRLGSNTKEEMRMNRFVQTFFKYGSSDWKTARKLSLDYIEICPHKGHLIPGAESLLNKLLINHKIHLITNGFSDTQRIKIESSGLMKYFQALIISEETLYRKPQREIFMEGIKRAQASIKKSIMIGDDWQSDIQGAKRAGIDQVFFNPLNKAVQDKGSTTYEIKKLSDLEEILNLSD